MERPRGDLAPLRELGHAPQLQLAEQANQNVLVLDPESGEYFALHESAALLWELCNGIRPVSSIVAGLPSEFEVDEPDEPIARADTVVSLDDLRRARLIAMPK
jgi:hypothetical protein